MTKGTKVGLIIALVGFFIPIISLPFTTKQRPKAGIVYNIANMEVVLYKGRAIKRTSTYDSILRKWVVGPRYTGYKGRIEFPYKYCFFAGSILICGGLCMALAYHQRKQKGG